MADIFEILKSSNGKLDAKEIIIDQITHILSALYVYKEMLGEREAEKALIESIRNEIIRLRYAIEEFLKI